MYRHLFAATVAAVLISGCAETDGGSPAGETSKEAKPAAAEATPAPKPKPRPTTLVGRLKQSVIDINLQGEGKVRIVRGEHGRRKEVFVYHELADNLTGGLVQRGAELDASKIFKELYTGPDRNHIGDVTVLSMGTLVDKLGNEEEGVTFSVTLPRAIAMQVNWANFDAVDLRDVWQVNVDRIG